METPDDIACTLDAGDIEGRVLDWADVVSHVRERTAIPDGIRVTFDPDFPVDRLAVLARAEHDCCAFLSFAITVDARGMALEIRSSPKGMAVVESLLGSLASR